MLLFTFVLAALLASLGCKFASLFKSPAFPRPAGLLLLAAAGTAGLIALTMYYWPSGHNTAFGSNINPDLLAARPVVPVLFVGALRLCVLVLGVYVLSALRGAAGFPTWMADIIVLICAVLAIWAEPEVLVRTVNTFRADTTWALPSVVGSLLTVLWIWGCSRLAASLHRTPVVAAGYLGIVSVTVLYMQGQSSPELSFFSWSTTAALGGAGLAAFFTCLFAVGFDLGWSALLVGGFALGLSECLQLDNKTFPGVVSLAALTVALPLLDRTFFRLRSSLRQKKLVLTGTSPRLHEALTAHGISPAKVSLLYLGLGGWFSLLCHFATLWLFTPPVNLWLVLVGTLLLAGLVAMGVIVFISVTRILMRRMPGETIPESIEAFGVRISPVSMEEALDKIESYIAQGSPHHVATTDANSILTSRDDEEYAGIMRRAALVTPDGFGVVWGARLLNLPIYERVTGVDMVTGICDRAARNGYKIYILGSSPGVAETAANNLTKTYPGLQFVGTHHGFWRRDGKEAGLTTEEADAKMADEICRAKPDVLFVAMGIPSQEKFIAAQMERLAVPVSLGVGGSFDVYSGKFNRAPVYVQRMGLEWLYRVWIDPSRWKRMGYVPRFMVVALKGWITGTSAPGAPTRSL